MSWNEQLDDAIRQTLDDGEMVLRWALMVELVDPDGGRNLSFMSSPDLMAWEALGMFEEGKLKNTEAILNRDYDDDDE